MYDSALGEPSVNHGIFTLFTHQGHLRASRLPRWEQSGILWVPVIPLSLRTI